MLPILIFSGSGKITTPLSKIKTFLWLVYHNRLFTKNTLSRIGINVEDRCSIPNHHTEDITHIFFECPLSIEPWNSILSRGFSLGLNINSFHLRNWEQTWKSLHNINFDRLLFWYDILPFLLYKSKRIEITIPSIIRGISLSLNKSISKLWNLTTKKF